jgi:NADPH-dependent 2,4-dienoyl-CoA reductase/sulfur reductase-like enzyme
VFDERGINAVFAAAVKKAVDIPVTTVGGFADPAQMERVLADGLADGIVMGRGIIADPDIPNKAKNGDQNARKCIRCFVCNEALYTTRNLRCSVNPTAGREFERKLARPAAKSKRVLVAGGGPGGMVAAVAAAKRGHCVTLFEKSDALGGALKTERFIPFKQDIVEFGRTLERELYAAGVDVRLGAPLTPETAAPAAADAVIAALGARPFIPPIAGADGPRVFTAESFLSGGADTRASAVIIVGGGLVGAELGLHLALLGIRATILEMRGGIAADAAPEYRRFLLAETEKQKDMLRCETGLRCTRVADGTVAAVPVGGGAEMLFGADAVILAAGYLPLRDEAEALRRCAPEFRVVGDCNRVARIYEAVRSGYDAGTGV